MRIINYFLSTLVCFMRYRAILVCLFILFPFFTFGQTKGKKDTTRTSKEAELKKLKKKTIKTEDGEFEVIGISVLNQEGIKDENIVTPVIEEDTLKSSDRVDVEASFPGGNAAWRNYLEIMYKDSVVIEDSIPAGTYQTMIQFCVNKDGSIGEIKPLSNVGYGLELKAIKIMKDSPKWIPAKLNYASVKSFRKQPFTFVVEK